MTHIVVAALYAATLWLATVAGVYYLDGPSLSILAFGPIVVSGIIVVIYAIEVVGWLVCVGIRRCIDVLRDLRAAVRAGL